MRPVQELLACRERLARVEADNERLREAADALAKAAAQYLDTGRGDLDGALAAYRSLAPADEASCGLCGNLWGCDCHERPVIRAAHTQECDDHAFVHHVATGGDAECICRAPSPPADEAKP